MTRRHFLKAFTFCSAFIAGLWLSQRDRKQYQTSTAGSRKWLEGHNVGCVFYAPDDVCICSEFAKESKP